MSSSASRVSRLWYELGVQFCRDLRARGDSAKGQPADKAFRDSLYEDT